MLFKDFRAVLNDDISLVNLETLLQSHSEGHARGKEFTFRGDPSYTGILKAAGIEQVNIANNHYIDFGGSGRESTRAALEAAGIGFSGYTYRSARGGERLPHRLRRLPRNGVSGPQGARVQRPGGAPGGGLRRDHLFLSLGQGVQPHHNQTQRRMADYAIQHGADIVVGTHPHCVQGVEHRRGSLILWSLGNLVFGGTHEMTTFDAVVAQVSLCFDGGEYQGAKLRLLPVLTSSARPDNNFQPEWAEGADYERIHGPDSG